MGSVCNYSEGEQAYLKQHYKNLSIRFNQYKSKYYQQYSVQIVDIEVVEDYSGSFATTQRNNYEIIRTFRQNKEIIYEGIFKKELLGTLHYYFKKNDPTVLVINQPGTRDEKYIYKVFCSLMQTLYAFNKEIGLKEQPMTEQTAQKNGKVVVLYWPKIQGKDKEKLFNQMLEKIPRID